MPKSNNRARKARKQQSEAPEPVVRGGLRATVKQSVQRVTRSLKDTPAA